MDDIVDYIASKIRKRSKRSLWGSIASIFNPEEMDDSDGYSPTVDGNKSSQGSPIPISSDKEIVSWSCSCSQPNVKDGAYYCYCAYVLRISRYSDFLSPMLTNTGIFLRGLKLSGERRS